MFAHLFSHENQDDATTKNNTANAGKYYRLPFNIKWNHNRSDDPK